MHPRTVETVVVGQKYISALILGSIDFKTKSKYGIKNLTAQMHAVSIYLQVITKQRVT